MTQNEFTYVTYSYLGFMLHYKTKSEEIATQNRLLNCVVYLGD